MPPDRMTALIQGHGTFITASLFGVYQGRGLQLTKPYSLQKTCGSTKKKNGQDRDLIHADTGVKQLL